MFEKAFPIKHELKGSLQQVASRLDLTSVYGQFGEDAFLKNSVYIVNDLILQLTKELQFVSNNG